MGYGESGVGEEERVITGGKGRAEIRTEIGKFIGMAPDLSTKF